MDKRISIMSAMIGIAFVGGVLGTSVLSTSDDLAQTSALGVKGHVTLAVYDEFGTVKQYIQGDNAILNDGHDCIVEMTLQSEIGNCAGTAGSNGAFTIVSLGTSSAAATQSQTTLLAASGNTQTGTVGNAVTAAAANGASADVVATFTDPGADTYNEAILTNSDGDVLARNTYTDAVLGQATDDLVITWTITSDG